MQYLFCGQKPQSIFANPTVGFPGCRFQSLFSSGASGSERGVIRITPVRGGMSVIGWAADLDRGGQSTVLFVDEAGTIVGFGRHLRAGGSGYAIGHPIGIPPNSGTGPVL